MTRDSFTSHTSFNFRGASEYLDDLVVKNDAPFLNEINTSFFNQLIFDHSAASAPFPIHLSDGGARPSPPRYYPKWSLLQVTGTLDSDQDRDQDQSYLGVVLGGRYAMPSSHNLSSGHVHRPGLAFGRFRP